MEQETAVPSYLLHIKSIDIRIGEYGEQDKKDISATPSHSIFCTLLWNISKVCQTRVRWRLYWKW